jgi:hypothetical protein
VNPYEPHSKDDDRLNRIENKIDSAMYLNWLIGVLLVIFIIVLLAVLRENGWNV